MLQDLEDCSEMLKLASRRVEDVGYASKVGLQSVAS